MARSLAAQPTALGARATQISLLAQDGPMIAHDRDRRLTCKSMEEAAREHAEGGAGGRSSNRLSEVIHRSLRWAIVSLSLPLVLKLLNPFGL